ncbi:hypothetical protein [Pedobacter sp. BMA]|uniref:hypothetical protein n=1 Tax=Pedobacter sp. BMA TaxID=1663685 RepID=UPI000649516C|nr:hypothetical protein [Pedobacter sp. BMA]KLT64437.1 hypothetical protein AB669_18020 [Pedobacter sp. BMA]
MQQINPILTFSFFHNSLVLPKKEVSSIGSFDRNAVIKFFVMLNVAVEETKRTRKTHAFVNNFIDALPSGYKQNALSFIKSHYLSTGPVVTEILVDLLNLDEPENTQIANDNSFALHAFDTILIYNEDRYSEVGVGKRDDSIELIWEMLIAQGLNAENASSYHRSGISKQLAFISFLKEFLKGSYPLFETALLKETGFKSIYDYPLIFTNLVLTYQEAIEKDSPLVVVPPDHYLYQILHVIDVVTYADNREEQKSLATVTTKPFIKLSDGLLYLTGISNFGLITEKCWNFYLFTKKLLPESLKVSRYSDLQSLWGKHYIERYLILGMLQSLQKSGIRVIGSDDGIFTDVTMIVNERDVYLFEIKSSSLVNTVTIEKSVEQFKYFIDKNFVAEKKGASQLNRIITLLAEKSQSDYKIQQPVKKLRIFPVLVYTENHLVKNGVNEYINLNAPKLSEEIAQQFQKIAPFTTIHYDFFIENLSELKRDRNLLKTTIENYHRKVATSKTKYKKFNSTKNYYDTLISFDDYAADGKQGLYMESHTNILEEMNKVFDFRKDANHQPQNRVL